MVWIAHLYTNKDPILRRKKIHVNKIKIVLFSIVCLVLVVSIMDVHTVRAEGSTSSVTATITIEPGVLSYTLGNATKEASVDGTSIVTLPIIVTDARGSGDGWTLFMNVNNASIVTYSFLINSESNHLPVGPQNYIGFTSGNLMSAGKDSGMGTTTMMLTLKVPESGATIDFALIGGGVTSLLV